MPDPKIKRIRKRNMSTPLSPSEFDAFKKVQKIIGNKKDTKSSAVELKKEYDKKVTISSPQFKDFKKKQSSKIKKKK
tara:strand:- start:94 stop:324 length:231 start_codon:yes stop_codon:yes gene_type:complete